MTGSFDTRIAGWSLLGVNGCGAMVELIVLERWPA